MDGQGRVWFGVYNGAHVSLNSAAGLNNNVWHMAVGTQSSAGMRLYIDGVLVGSNANTVAETQNGWWRAGCGNLSGWGDAMGREQQPGHGFSHHPEPALLGLTRRDHRLLGNSPDRPAGRLPVLVPLNRTISSGAPL